MVFFLISQATGPRNWTRWSMLTAPTRRNWIAHAVAIAIVAWVAINIHRYDEFLPDLVVTYVGVCLGALAAYLAIGMVFSSAATWQAAAGAFAITTLVEFTRLYYAPWLDSMRGT